jgi:hypothetical protein
VTNDGTETLFVNPEAGNPVVNGDPARRCCNASIFTPLVFDKPAASANDAAGLSNTSGVNMLALQHLLAGSPLTTGLPASGLTNSVSVPSLVTNSFHTQQTQESHQQPQHPQNQQVVTALNGSPMAGCGISPAAANSNHNAGMNSVALHRTLSVPGMDQSTEQLQSMHSNASSFPNYTGLTIPNQITCHSREHQIVDTTKETIASASAIRKNWPNLNTVDTRVENLTGQSDDPFNFTAGTATPLLSYNQATSLDLATYIRL